MITVLKLTIANIKQKKFRTALIVLSIILSVSLLYTVMSLSSQVTSIFEQKVKKEVGNAQLMILPEENSGEQYLTELDFENLQGMDYQIPLINAYGYSKIDEDMLPVVFSGMSIEDYRTIYGLDFIEKNTEQLSGDQVFIGEESAEVYKLKLGDKLEVTINNKPFSFTIEGIIKDKNNNLGYNLGSLSLITPKNTLANILGISNKVSAYYIKTDKQTTITEEQAKLSEAFPEEKINDVTDMSDFKQSLQMITTSLFLMVTAVIIVSAFIIYSSFKIIAIERMPLMGTLRSIGATRKVTIWTLLSEAIFYGVTGGVLGDALGIALLSGIMKVMLKSFGVNLEKTTYIHLNYFLIALLIGLALSIGSALSPIRKMSKRSIRSIIFAEILNEKHISIYKTMIGTLLIIVAFIIFKLAPITMLLPLNLLAMLMVTIGGSMIIPMLSRLLMRILTLFLKPIYKDKFDIVTTNLKNDQTMMNNILLLAMGLGVILMINNFSTTVGIAVTDVYGTCKTDAVAFYDLQDSFIEKVKAVEGVEHVYTNKEVMNLTANNGKIDLMMLEGIDGRGYSEYAWDEFGDYLTDKLLAKFKSTRSVLLSRYVAGKYDLSIGDMLDIDFNGKIVPYEVIAIVPSIMNNGNMTFTYEDFLTEDAGVKNSHSMYINLDDTYDSKQVMQKIKELMPYGILPIQTLQDMRNQNIKANNGLFFMMKAISVIAMFIGVVGILNNFTISFLSRRKLMATMRSLGLSKKSTVLNMLLEAFICGLLGTLSGLILGTILIEAMGYVVNAMGIPSDMMFYSMKDYLFVLASGIVLSLASAILPALSIVKENIVSGLRYE